MAPSTTFETLPDEIILIACQYLRGADVLYSFYNLNTRLNITITENRVIMHTIPCHLRSMNLRATMGKQMSSQSKYTQQVEDLYIYDATSLLEILLILQHFRRIRTLVIQMSDGPEIQKVEALNSLKIVGSIELQERPNEEVLTKIIDYTIGEMETLKAGNEQKISEIQRINSQLNKALEVNNMKRSLFYNN
ncbi:unnamed protein product [Rotaria sordida]|nr:unnamed protein product [Rotaria sordida]